MKFFAFALVLGLIASSACANDAKVTELWYGDCSRCHAPDGSGKCPLGRSLKVKDYTSREAQEIITDEMTENLLRNGKIREGKQVMPAYRGLDKAQVEELKQLIRNLSHQKKRVQF